MSNTTNVGNFSVKSFTSPSSVPEGDYIDDYLINYLTLVPDNGFAINASDFSAATQLPNYVSSVVFFQSAQDSSNVICQVNLVGGSVMPSGGIDIELCISGFSSTANYNIKGLFDYARSSNVVPATLGANYNSNGSFEATENVFTQSVSAVAGYYFPRQPTISLSIGDNSSYTSSFSNDTDVNGNIINTVFTINYIFPDYNITGDLWEIIADAQVIYVPVVEITNYTINTSLFSEQGGQRYYSIFGSENANWVLTASNSNNINDILLINSTTGDISNTLSGTLDSTGFAEVLIIIPPSASPQSFDLLISGDLANPFAQPTTATLQQVADVTQTYATLSNNGLVVTPGNYTKTGFSYASYTAPNQPLTSVAWTVAPSSASNLVTLLNTSDIEDNIANNDLFEIEFTTSGTSTVHSLVALDPAVVVPNTTGWKFIQGSNYSPSIYVVLYDQPNNTITFNTSITVVAGQVETIGNNNGNRIEAPLIVSEVLPNVTISGNILVDQFGFADNTFTFLLDQFLVESAIPTLVTKAITNIEPGPADSGGEQINDNYAQITIKGIEWSEFSDFSVILGTTDNDNGTADYTSSLAGLVGGNTYHVRAYATNYSGTGYGQTESFLQPVPVAAPSIVTTGISNETGTAADSGGETITDGGGTVSQKGIQWSADNFATPPMGATAQGGGTASFASTITGLTAGNTYYVRAFVVNEAGTSYGQVVSFVSSVTVPCGSTASSGGNGIRDININLDSAGGIVAFAFDAYGAMDKGEIIHGTAAGTKKATTSRAASGNSGPAFDGTWGTEPTNAIPTQAQISTNFAFIGSGTGVAIPTRLSEFTTSTGKTATMPGYQQIVWWEYTAADYQTSSIVTIRITGAGSTSWRLQRICCTGTTCS